MCLSSPWLGISGFPMNKGFGDVAEIASFLAGSSELTMPSEQKGRREDFGFVYLTAEDVKAFRRRAFM